MKQIGIIMALLPLKLMILETVENCSVSPPDERMVVCGPHGLEIRSQEMGSCIQSLYPPENDGYGGPVITSPVDIPVD